MDTHYKRASLAGLLVALGIIYGDIGTSPLYTFQTIIDEGGGVTKDLIFGAYFLHFLDTYFTNNFQICYYHSPGG